MNRVGKTGMIVLCGLAVALVLALDSSCFAQCSMCKASLAGSGNSSFIRNFNIAVLVLLIPPVAMFCSIFVVLKRHKTRDDETTNSREEP